MHNIDYYFLQCQIHSNINSNWLFDKLLPSLIGSGTALFVFYLTTRRDRNKDLIKKVDDIHDKVTYLKNTIASIINIAKQQNENINECIEKIKGDNIKFHLMRFFSLTDFVRAINMLSKEEYYSAFVKHYKEKFDASSKYTRLISNVDFLHAQFLELIEILKKSQQFDQERKLKYQETVDKTSNMIEWFLFNNKENIPSELIPLLEIFTKFTSELNDCYDISYYNKQLVYPIKNFLIKLINHTTYKVPNEIVIIANNFRDADHLYEFIAEQNMQLLVDFKDISIKVSETIVELTENHSLL